MMKRATISLAALYNPTHVKGPKKGFGRHNKLRSKASDNVPYYDKGPVEWIPRPVRLTAATVDQVRDWMMRETLDNRVEEFNKIRDLHRSWSQHPKRPVLGDSEPRFPRGIYKMNHKARGRFLYRWHKANSPNNWMWLPKVAEGAPHHRGHGSEFPENWRALMEAGKLRR